MKTTDGMQQGIRLRQTRRFIASDPSSIVLGRNVQADDGAGGFTTTATAQRAQVFKVVQKAQSDAVERRNMAGEVVRPAITLVCMPDANIQRGDTFTWEGLAAEVVWLTRLDYVLHAEVAL